MVGYAERCEIASGDDDEQSFWREYLLYHRSEGFAFLVDAEDGWSWSAPITGVPERAGDGVKYQGVLYRKLYDYAGKATYVLGEFYWKLERDAKTFNTDYMGTGAFGTRRLNREQTGQGADQEVVWSAGETLSADAVLKAFKLAPEKSASFQRDALPSSGNAASLLGKAFFWVFVVVILLMMFRCDDSRDCSQLRATYGEASAEYQNCLRSASGGGRSGGGSFGGWSGGGSHK